MRRTIALGVLIGALVLGVGPAAHAHPLGNFTVNRYAEIVVGPETVTVRYVVDLAEIPSFQELQRIGDGDGALQRWADRTAAEVASDVILRIGERRALVRVGSATAALSPGQGGLSLLRLEVAMSAALHRRTGLLTFEDRNDPGRMGWREITARGTDGVALVGATVPAVSVTDGLRSYPDGLLSSPLAETGMQARFRPGSTSGSTGSEPATSVVGASTRVLADGGSFARLLDRRGALLMLLGVLAALALGAWHALLPGHGKTLMAAAMVGSGARTRQAVTAGVSVAAMHTVSVIGLGVLILALEQAFRPEAVYPWLQLASGVVAVAIGLHLVRSRWRSSRRWSEASPTGHVHAAGEDHPHLHGHEIPSEGLLSRRGIAALAFAGGVLPSPSALIVLLASIQRGRAVYGLGLVLAFSVGLAASLVLVGVGLMRAGRIADRRRWGRLGLVAPLGSAAAIVAIGVVVASGGLASL